MSGPDAGCRLQPRRRPMHTIAYLGPAGTFGEEAAIRYAADRGDVAYLPLASIPAVPLLRVLLVLPITPSVLLVALGWSPVSSFSPFFLAA